MNMELWSEILKGKGKLSLNHRQRSIEFEIEQLFNGQLTIRMKDLESKDMDNFMLYLANLLNKKVLFTGETEEGGPFSGSLKFERFIYKRDNFVCVPATFIELKWKDGDKFNKIIYDLIINTWLPSIELPIEGLKCQIYPVKELIDPSLRDFLPDLFPQVTNCIQFFDIPNNKNIEKKTDKVIENILPLIRVYYGYNVVWSRKTYLDEKNQIKNNIQKLCSL